MIESLLEEISSLSKEEFEENQTPGEDSAQTGPGENTFLATLPVVRAIVNRKTSGSWHAEGADLIQTIALRLWNWRERYEEKSDEMSPKEWESFAARTAYNEVNRYFSNQKADLNVPIEDAQAISTVNSAEGNTKAEFHSLAAEVWQNICTLSLRQKRSLLLQSDELVVHLITGGINEEELIKVLEFSPVDWENIKLMIPLTDAQIAELVAVDKQNPKALTKSIKKGRHEARKRLRRLLDK